VPNPTVQPVPPAAAHPAGARRPELLAPAGDWECAHAAVENGADAIYFGLSRFNARLRAHNFTDADLPGLMEWLHRRGVRGYLTFNTLVFPHELAEAEAYLRTVIAAGVDAAIVQDVGICRLIRGISPDFPIHASTQMTITSAAGVEFARELGCQLVVLARENSIPEIGRIETATREQGTSLPLEVFVHGALCVAYSGQCLTSEALGGRSANRGECAQACRLPYELLADGQPVELGDRRYLLSPQDLAGLDVLPDLVRSGVASLKIEGRLKTPEYVASITRIYRAALDRLFPQATAAPTTTTGSQAPGTTGRTAGYEMEMAFSRGLFPGWLGGIDNQRLVHARFGKKRGVLIGTVSRVGRDRVWLSPIAPIKAGDGVVFDAGRPAEPEEGGRVFERHGPAGTGPNIEIALTFLRDAVDFGRIQPGHRVWKTSDPELDRELRQTYEGETPRFQRPISMEVHGGAGEPLVLIARDADGHLGRAESAMPLAAAERQPLEETRLRDQLGRLGGTPFRLESLTNRLAGAVILPVSELNRVRREAVARLEEARTRPGRWTLRPGDASASTRPNAGLTAPDAAGSPVGAVPCREPRLAVLVRTIPQLDAVLALPQPPAAVYCEFEDPKRYRETLARVRAESSAQGRPCPGLWVAPPRIFKPGEEWILKLVMASEADGYLVRNHEHLRCFGDRPRIGDFSLNVANCLTAEHFIRRHGLGGVTASYDLNADQLEALLRSAPPDWFEIVLHQHMPMFHMEHCVFCAFLSKGRDYRDCGRPCDRIEVRLKDRVGAAHPVKADAGCRNTVFNARAQTGADHAARLMAAGACRFRIEFLDESPADVPRLIDHYRRLLRGETTAESLWREFKLINQLGVTRGQLGKATGADLGVDRWADSKAYAAAW
jgi:putative protease